MACSKGSVNLVKPNEQLTVEARGLRTFALGLLRLAGNSPQKRLFAESTTYRGVIPAAKRRTEIETHRATAYENFRRAQIR